jgi:hypothetical protein
MSIAGFRKKHGIPIKRGMKVGWFSWSTSKIPHLIRDFRGTITSVKGNIVHCSGYCWWAKAKFRFDPWEKNVVIYNDDDSILWDTREKTPRGCGRLFAENLVQLYVMDAQELYSQGNIFDAAYMLGEFACCGEDEQEQQFATECHRYLIGELVARHQSVTSQWEASLIEEPKQEMR